ncbi:hypothetical protein D3C78_943170 [compost metagenome]
MQGFEQFAFPRAGVGRAAVQTLKQVFSLQGRSVGVLAGLFVARVAKYQTVANFDDALGPCGNLAVMRNEDHHMALIGQLIEQGHDFSATLAVQGASGLVGEDDMATVHQRAGN